MNDYELIRDGICPDCGAKGLQFAGVAYVCPSCAASLPCGSDTGDGAK